MRFIVLGVGSIGARHARNLQALGHEVLAMDPDAVRLESITTSLGIEGLGSLEAAADRKADGVLICAPPDAHVPLAREVLVWGAHLFVEKPLAPSARAARELTAAADARSCRILVGSNLRFFRPLVRMKTLVDEGRIGRVLSVRAQCGFYLPSWKPGTDYRATYRAHARQGGGILLDAIHEFDYLRWIFGAVEEVLATTARQSALDIDVEDLAEVTLRFASGAIGQLHLDYLQRSYRRDCEVIGEAGVLVWDYINRRLELFDAPDRWQGFGEPIDVNHNEMFVEEMRHFVRCVEGQDTPIVDGHDAVETLELVDAVKASSTERTWVRP